MTNSKNYLRQVVVSEEQFTLLLKRLEQEIEKDLQNNKMKKRGIPSQAMPIESKLYLTLTYLRHYPTFSILGTMFGFCNNLLEDLLKSLKYNFYALKSRVYFGKMSNLYINKENPEATVEEVYCWAHM